METTNYLRISNMPVFESVCHLLKILHELPSTVLEEMEKTIGSFGEQKEAPLDWTDPESWIESLPDGNGKNLAKRIWNESNHITNPRYLQAEKSLINQYKLAIQEQGTYRVTKEGEDFSQNEAGRVVLTIDRLEGTVTILSKLVTAGTSKSSDILPDFEQFIMTHVQRPPKSMYSYLNTRLNNLVSRQLVVRSGNFYDISPKGRRYLEELDPENRVQRIAEDAEQKNTQARKQLKEALHRMDPFVLEEVIAELFRLMGYDNVQDTQKTHDGGVDVIAEKDFGFGVEKVVIQVKRHASSINRGVISQLRDDIRAFAGATRGIIVTTSSFNNDAEERASEAGQVPINLIDGEKLINLMIDNKLGIKTTLVTYHEFDPDSLIIKDEATETIG